MNLYWNFLYFHFARAVFLHRIDAGLVHIRLRRLIGRSRSKGAEFRSGDSTVFSWVPFLSIADIFSAVLEAINAGVPAGRVSGSHASDINGSYAFGMQLTKWKIILLLL